MHQPNKIQVFIHLRIKRCTILKDYRNDLTHKSIHYLLLRL